MLRLFSELRLKIFIAFVALLECCAFSQTGSANPLERLILLIQTQPEYLEAKSKIALSDWTVANIRADGMPSVSFSSSGKYPIISSADRSSRSNAGDRYIDGLFTMKVPISDAGERQKRIDAENDRKRSAELSLTILEEEMLYEIMETGLKINKNEAFIASLDSDFKDISERRDIEKLRYQGGTGTITIVREMELMALELESQRTIRSLELELLKTRFLERYSVDPSDYITNILELSMTPMISGPPENQRLKLKKYDFDKQEIDNKIDATRLSQYPKIDVNLTAGFYNVTKKFLSDRELYGGVGMSLPIFDSGATKSEIKSLVLQKEITLRKKEKARSSIRLQETDIQSQLIQNKEQVSEKTKIKQNLEKSLAELETKAKSISASTFEQAKTFAKIREIMRELDDLAWDNRILELKLASVQETLKTSLMTGQN